MNFNAKILINSYLAFNNQNKIKEQSQTLIEEGDVIKLTISYGSDREPLNDTINGPIKWTCKYDSIS